MSRDLDAEPRNIWDVEEGDIYFSPSKSHCRRGARRQAVGIVSARIQVPRSAQKYDPRNGPLLCCVSHSAETNITGGERAPTTSLLLPIAHAPGMCVEFPLEYP